MLYNVNCKCLCVSGILVKACNENPSTNKSIQLKLIFQYGKKEIDKIPMAIQIQIHYCSKQNLLFNKTHENRIHC